MRSAILLLCVAIVAQAQTRPRPTEPTRFRPGENTDSECRVMDSESCPEGQVCLERRDITDRPIYRCVMRLSENATCRIRDFFEGDRDEETGRRVVDSDRPLPERAMREVPQGGRDRTSSRMLNGVDARPPCAQTQRCNEEQMCVTPPTDSRCAMQRRANNATRCDEQGRFEPQQCRRLPGEETPILSGLRCFCANITSGQMIQGTTRRVEDQDDLPDCERRSFRSCSEMRDRKMVQAPHDQSIPRSMGGRCQSCQCNDGNLRCTPRPEPCSRSDTDDSSRRSCMMDGEMVPHNERRQDKCNMCGCRNGNLQCTRIPNCKEDADMDRDEGEETERERVDRECEECMNMPASPVCAVRDGRTFPTRCHAMRCQGFSRDEVEDGPCASRDNCDRDRCGSEASCFELGGQTKMSRAMDSPEDRRLCVNRQQLHCRPTQTVGGMRTIEDRDDQGEEDITARFFQQRREAGDRDGRNRDDDNARDFSDQTVCGGDGNSYPSTCHMMIESRGDIPRVRHSGPCRDDDQDSEVMPTRETDRTVCGRDGVTYSSMDTMRTRGGNVEGDYMGRCMQQGSTPMEKCMMVKENKRCPDLSNCTRRVMPMDGCCPICGSTVIVAIDQEAVDEHVRTTDELRNVDDLMTGMLRDKGRIGQGMIKPPEINSSMIARRCNISMSRPTQRPGNNTEIMFKARNMSMDAMFCHEMAMNLMRRLNMDEDVVSIETSFAAAAAVAPEDEVQAGAPAFAASCMVLLCTYLISLLF